MKNIVKIIAVLMSIVSCRTNQKEPPSQESIQKESRRANEFFERSFNFRVDRSPMFQTYLGIRKDYDKWDDISSDQDKKDYENAIQELRYLEDSINYDLLNESTKLSYRLFQFEKENDVHGYKYRLHDYPVNQMFGLHTQVPSFLINMHLITNIEDAEAYLKRLEKVEFLFDQLIENLKEREEKDIVLPKFLFPKVLDACQNIIQGAPFSGDKPSTLLQDFSTKVGNTRLSQDEKDALVERCRNDLVDFVKPSYDKLMAFLEDQETRATDKAGIWKVPEGNSYYDFVLKKTTTTDMSMDQIHAKGLSEVKRIHSEMHKVMLVVGFNGSLQEFFKFMREDQQFYYPNTEEGEKAYLDSARSLIAIMQSRLDELFITQPKAEIVVKQVEPFREKTAGKAFYQSPAPDGSRPGTFYANLFDTRTMPKYEMEALVYHEGLPGHHMERTISQELKKIPQFRKFGGYTAFIEGWGLYSEYVPKEMGMYKNPYANFGRLSMELWRACRLVVDTGIHGKKWTREKGIAYYAENTPANEQECIRMVDRHIVMPSQATAYKVGMLKILELREKAKQMLASKFDIREFHEVVLTSGALPLTELEVLVENWIVKTNH